MPNDELRGRVVKAILLGGLAAGTLDILDPLLIWLPRGIPPGRIFQSVATGLLGPAAFTGGTSTVLLGAFLHYFIATTWATVFVLASVQVPALRRRWVVFGPAFGLIVYCVMYYVVLRLSLARARASYVPWQLANNLGIHMLGIGLPIAWITSRCLPAWQSRSRSRGR